MHPHQRDSLSRAPTPYSAVSTIAFRTRQPSLSTQEHYRESPSLARQQEGPRKFCLCLSARQWDANEGRYRWINNGSFEFLFHGDNDGDAYENVLNCLNEHTPTTDPRRKFYIWPGFEYTVPLQSSATFTTRLARLIETGLKWAHLSLEQGLPVYAGSDSFTDMRQLFGDLGHVRGSAEPSLAGTAAQEGANIHAHRRKRALTATDGNETGAASPEKRVKPSTSALNEESKNFNDNVGAKHTFRDDVDRKSDFASNKAMAFPVTQIDAHGGVPVSPSNYPQVAENDKQLLALLEIQMANVTPEQDDVDIIDPEESSEDAPTSQNNKDVDKAILTADMQMRVIDKVTTKHMERVREAEWLEACSFWGIDLHSFREAKSIPLQDTFWNLHQPASPAQLHEAWDLYMQELSDRNGGIFANMMGMGKTRTMVLMMVIGHAHLVNKLAVEAAWRSRDKTHLPQKAKAGSKCPTAGLRPFACFCEPGSVFRTYSPRVAPTLLSGGGKSKQAWVEEISGNVLGSKWCDPVQTTPPMRFCWLAKPSLIVVSKTAEASLAPPTEQELSEMRCRIDFTTELREFQNSGPWERAYTLDGKKHLETPLWELAHDAPQNHPHASEDLPSPTAGRFILLVNYKGISSAFTELSQVNCTAVRTITKKGGRVLEYKKMPVRSESFVLGRTILDEFHLAKSQDTLMCTVYQKLRNKGNKGYQWKSWALSGTPLESGLAEVLTFVSLALPGIPTMHHPHGNWKDESGKWRNEVYAKIANDTPTKSAKDAPGLVLARDWKKLINSCGRSENAADEAIQSDVYKKLTTFGPDVLKTWVFWRTWETKNPWGHCLGGIDAEFNTFFKPCRVPGSHEDILEMTFARFKQCTPEFKGDTFPYQWQCVFASFPYLAVAMTAEREKGNFSSLLATLETSKISSLVSIADTVAEKEKEEGKQLNPLTPHLEQLLNTSPKFQVVKKECTLIELERKSRSKDASRNDGKILIGSSRPICQMVLYLGLVDNFGKNAVTYLPGGLDSSDSYERIQRWRKPEGPWILVASIQAYAESVTFVEAHTVVLLEPQTQLSQQEQFATRILRKGQRAKLCTGIVLYNPDAKVEQSLLVKQLFKKRANHELGNSTDDPDAVVPKTDWNWASNDTVVWRLPGVPLPST